jgi:hypothetical protein
MHAYDHGALVIRVWKLYHSRCNLVSMRICIVLIQQLSPTSIYQCPSATKSTPVGGWAMMINSSSGLLGQLVADVDTSGLASISYDRYSWPTLTTSLIPSSSIPLITSASYSALNVLSTGNYFACIRLY